MRNGLTTQIVPTSRIDASGPRPRYITGRPTRAPYRQLDTSLRENLRRRAELLDQIGDAARAGREADVVALAAGLDAHRERGRRLSDTPTPEDLVA